MFLPKSWTPAACAEYLAARRGDDEVSQAAGSLAAVSEQACAFMQMPQKPQH